MPAKIYTFEVEETQSVSEVERFIEALRELKHDLTLALEEKKLVIITTERQDVAAVLETIFNRPEVKQKGSRKPKPESNITIGNGNGRKPIPEPLGLAPYQGS